MSLTVSQQNTRPGLGAIAIIAKGSTITTGAAAASTAIPDTIQGAPPNRIRLASTAACYARLGTPAEGTAAVAAAGTGYVNGEVITLAGGTFTSPMKVSATTLKLISAASNVAGSGYVQADTITLAGGTFSAAAVVDVVTTKVSAVPTIAAAGTGGTPGTATVTGTTGTGTKFQASVTISGGGAITSVDSLTVAGSYTVNPTLLTNEPVTGGGLTGAQLSILMGVATVTVSTPGNYTVTSAALTQSATSGSGTGATFQTGSFGLLTVTVTQAGAYTVEPANPVAQGSTTGSGASGTINVTWATAASAGDMLIYPGEALIVDALGFDHVSAIQVTGAGVLQVSPVEN